MFGAVDEFLQRLSVFELLRLCDRVLPEGQGTVCRIVRDSVPVMPIRGQYNVSLR